VEGKRWWNVKHPMTYQKKVMSNESPTLNEEILTAENLSDEFVMLQIRRREGIDHSRLSEIQLKAAREFLLTGHLDDLHWANGKLVLSQSGRLIADRIVRELVL
jgi:oxygen-independent coproporphyrinogen-3 oxidase